MDFLKVATDKGREFGGSEYVACGRVEVKQLSDSLETNHYVLSRCFMQDNL